MASFGFIFIKVFLLFSTDQIECQIEISKGAGIHPRNAIRKVISTVPYGKI